MLIGHKKQWQFLRKSFELGKIPHGFLFQGPEKLGKRTLAFEFIKLVNCQDKELSARPCQKCLSCQAIEKRVHPDLIFVEPQKKQIQIAQIRDLSLKLAKKPSLAYYKSAIIDQAHLMTREAQSCFLKTLEEPKGRAILILITEYPDRLLPTILSRIQRIKFHPLPKKEIKNYLISQGLSEKKAEDISFFSFGKPGLAIELFSEPTKFAKLRQRISQLIKIYNSPLASRFLYSKDLSFEPDNLNETLEIWLRYLRETFLTKIGISSDFRLPTQNLFDYSLSKFEKVINLIEDTIFYISTTNVNPRFTLENLMLEL